MFRSSNALFVDRFSTILSAFLSGYHAVLVRRPDLPAVRRELEGKFGEFYRGFAFEGLGMGLGARTLWHPAEKKRFESRIRLASPQYLYQYYVGLGWWWFKRYGFRVRGYRRFLRCIDPFYGPIALDGVGFCAGLLRIRRRGDLPRIARKWAGFDAAHARICYQGLGRSFWFLYEFNMLRALQAVEEIPSVYRGDAISGLGLAVAYSFFDDLPSTFRMIDWVPPELKPAFMQGLAFGWQARKLQTPQFDSYVNGYVDSLSEPVLLSIHIVETVRGQLFERRAKPCYTEWLDEVRERMDEVRERMDNAGKRTDNVRVRMDNAGG